MAKKKNWVDFKEVRKQVSLEMVLRHYGFFDDLKLSGNNLVSCCPIHKGSNPRQFSVNLERNLWNCFGNCKEGGNILDFVAMMEFGNKKSPSIRKAGLILTKWFLTGAEGRKPETAGVSKPVRIEAKDGNKPLSFELKNLIMDHAFFTERGIDPETIDHFGLGFCQKGMMKDRIVIPVHDEQDHLVAYCGRAVTQEQADDEGKYKQPPDFNKSRVVYNLNRQPRNFRILILVESFLSVWKAHQAGYPNTVALMGSHLSEHQENLIVGHFDRPGGVILLFDSDDDGRKCADDCLLRLGKRLFVKAVDISPLSRKPHHLNPEQFKSLF